MVRLLKAIWHTAHRGRQSGPNNASTSPDVDGTPLWIECKRQKAEISYSAHYKKTVEQRNLAGDPRPVAVIGRKDRAPAMIHMELEAFLKLLEYGS